MNRDKVIDEIAFLVGDPKFSDFARTVYSRAYYRAARQISKRYELHEKLNTFTISDVTDSLTDDIILDIADFKVETKVLVNGVPLHRRADFIMDDWTYCYYIERREGKLVFNYRLGPPIENVGTDLTDLDITPEMSSEFFERTTPDSYSNKNLTDVVNIFYMVMPSQESDINEYVFPEQFEDELIREGVIYIARTALSTFSGEQILQRYSRTLKIYEKKGLDVNLIEKSEPIIIQPFRYP